MVLAANNLEPGTLNATAWSVEPTAQVQKVAVLWLSQEEARYLIERRRERPQHCAHPSWFMRCAAPLTLRTQRAGTAMTNVCGIQDP
ncbi:hypothetical protein KSX_71650 [Ktedonospora formicarum]|uniref:Uncharacterized protein n=2 Tax=Ktedonospora formicarum TaxID=2778364 RepID=A0A8J3MU74_9CHLR|nr:hypothetical protein KSX_71650 [Ktedonospora formicarum]